MASGDDKIKLFKFTQKLYRNIGILPPKSNPRISSPINLKNFLFLLCLTQFFTSTVAYLWFDVHSMTQYGVTFYSCTSIAFAITLYVILLWQMENILKYIQNCERFIEKSEYLLQNRRNKQTFHLIWINSLFWMCDVCVLQERIHRSSMKIKMKKSKD